MNPAVIILALHILSVLQAVNAWTFVWRNASDLAFVKHDQRPISCTQMNNAQGELFEWDSEVEPFAISLCANTDCSGPPRGYATHFSNKNASKPILLFKVDSIATKTTSSTSTTSRSRSSTSSTTQTLTATPALRPPPRRLLSSALHYPVELLWA